MPLLGVRSPWVKVKTELNKTSYKMVTFTFGGISMYFDAVVVFVMEVLTFFQIGCGHTVYHGLRTPNKGINQRYLKNWADVADKICCRHT